MGRARKTEISQPGTSKQTGTERNRKYRQKIYCHTKNYQDYLEKDSTRKRMEYHNKKNKMTEAELFLNREKARLKKKHQRAKAKLQM